MLLAFPARRGHQVLGERQVAIGRNNAAHRQGVLEPPQGAIDAMPVEVDFGQARRAFVRRLVYQAGRDEERFQARSSLSVVGSSPADVPGFPAKAAAVRAMAAINLTLAHPRREVRLNMGESTYAVCAKTHTARPSDKRRVR